VVVCNVRYFLDPFTGPVRIADDEEAAASGISGNGAGASGQAIVPPSRTPGVRR